MDSLQKEFASYLVNNYCNLAATVLVLYDLVLTTEDEIRLFWRRKLTGATVLFWLNKWLITVYFTLGLASILTVPDASCAVIAKTMLIVDGLMYMVWGLFTALRTYALLTGNWFLTLVIFLLYGVSVGVNMSQFAFGVSGVSMPLLNCVEVVPVPAHLVKLFTVLSRASLIGANFLAVGATWFTVRRDHGFSYLGQLGGLRRTLAGVLLWDGFIYFIVLALIDSLHLTLNLLSLSDFIGTANVANDLIAFSGPITAVLVSRFMLHLQYANARTTGMASLQEPTASNAGSLMFERGFGSLSASISPNDYFPADGDPEYDSVEDSLVEGVSEEGPGEWHDLHRV